MVGITRWLLLLILGVFSSTHQTNAIKCPDPQKFGHGPVKPCVEPSDPNKRPPSGIETWFTESVFNDLFPKSNLGWGPDKCSPYNYEAFKIAARYFPKFGNEYVTKNPNGTKLNTDYTANETFRRDVAAFFAHAVQETGENDAHLYDKLPKDQASDCFYRGGFYNWFEGGPVSSLVQNQGANVEDGVHCIFNALYCNHFFNNTYFYPCNSHKEGDWYKGCYFGRGAIQISYSFNYGLFNRWLLQNNIKHQGQPIDLLKNPNLVITKMDPPLSILASLWFYMTPQSPKPAMHDIVVGNWVSPDTDYNGGVFGPTSLVINKECNGEDPQEPGGGGESRRIKAFRWFTNYFKVPFNSGDAKTVSCKQFNGGSKSFKFPKGMTVYLSWDIDWKTSADPTMPCTCNMKVYQGPIVAFDPVIMPQYKHQNEANKKWCENIYQRGWNKQACANHTVTESSLSETMEKFLEILV
ncbi:uncharacterized protein [Clytia hemisphaerica]|uniref:Glycoside hydrolase family 19 catalytic domain-containing protein n=1 Tax=Clytia hemisphaerica TaxID=252671 RepID=A0A7M5XNM0_9CNID